MKGLEGGLNLDRQGLDVDLLVRAAHLHEDLPGCPARKSGVLYFRRRIRHTGAGSHIELPTMPGAGYDRSYEVSLSEWAAPMDTGVMLWMA